MKPLLQSLTILAILIFTGIVIATAQSNNQLPNILWISCEDLSPHFEFYGDNSVATPNLSRLSREGITYDNVFTTAGVCAPSRCAIITGVNQVTAGGHNMRTLLNTFPERTGLPQSYSIVPPQEIKAFPEYLRAKGYYCTNNSKTDYQFEAPPTVWDEVSDKATWRNRKEGQPFFAVVNFMVTHESQVWFRKNHPMHVDPAKVKLPPLYPDTRTVRNDVARFFSNVADLDSLVGNLIRELEIDHLLENTIIFFWSDHGDGLPFFKRELYDRGLHVPLVVRFPGQINAGKREARLISSIDFAPTVLSLAGIQPPPYMQGKAFLGKYKTKEGHRYVYAARDRMDSEYERVRALRDTQYKYIRNFYPERPLYQNIEFRLQQDMMKDMLQLKDKGELDSIQMKWFVTSKPSEELYDVKADPYELKNLANDPKYKATLLRLRKEMDEWLIKVKDLGAVEEKQLISRMWQGGDHPPSTAAVIIKVSNDNVVTLSCDTKGASIGFKIIEEGNEPSSWTVYTQPFKLAKGQTVKAVAQRIGFEKSGESTVKM
jgi:N-sulfoglucosamine sulfohydrolase